MTAAIDVRESVTESVREMSSLVGGIAAATEGGHAAGPGLGQLAEDLRSQVLDLVATVRGS